MEGIFCANFCEPRGKWLACWKTWHAGCYECLVQEGKFPVRRIQDEEGNKWYKHETRLYCINHRVRGAHASIHFQCEDCWMINLEGHLPAEGLDDAYIMLIRRANLDAMGGRAVATIEAHAVATSEVESKTIPIGHPISCCHALVVRSFFFHCKVIISP
jgi:hypothetical protein